ncbi:MAG: DNA repair protein RecN [Eubacteriales bacterium]|nr:DNA repair protein RecN [Eubacteriales bacterium]
MLVSLRVQNLALLRDIELEGELGFTAIVGESGAGKSLMIQAIKAICGERCGRDLIRSGCDEAYIEAIFDRSPDRPWPEFLGEPEDQLVFSRSLRSNGRSYFRINGRSCTQSQFRDIASQYAEIHGQNDSQKLFDVKSHITFLDKYGAEEISTLKQRYQDCFRSLRALLSSGKNLIRDPEERERLMLRLEKQIEVFDRLKLEAGEEERLLERRQLLESAAIKQGQVDSILERYYSGSEASPSLEESLDVIAANLSTLADDDDFHEALAQRFQDLKSGLSELIDSLRRRSEEGIDEGMSIEAIDLRLRQIAQLKQRFHCDFDGLLSYEEKLRQRYKQIDDSIPRIEAYEAEYRRLETELSELAAQLSTKRKHFGEALESAIESELRNLSMPSARFVVSFLTKEAELDGCDQIEFLFSGNYGEAAKPLAQIASGGEASRIMLAIKVVLNQIDESEILVFDEVDTGISGEASRAVAKCLKRLSSDHQVFCVSHQAQIAAQAEHMLRVEKFVQGERTESRIQVLDSAGKEEEIVRLLGYAHDEASARVLARDLLQDL